LENTVEYVLLVVATILFSSSLELTAPY
jgi:hypothetical protein